MEKKESPITQQWRKFAQALWLEIPEAAAKMLTGEGDEAAVNNAGWNAYDAFVSLANEATNQFYANSLVGSLTGRTIERTLQMQRLTSAAAAAFFGNLWPAIGLPTAGEVASLRHEIAALHAELSDAKSAQAQTSEPAPAARATDGLSLVSNGRVKHTSRGVAEDAAA